MGSMSMRIFEVYLFVLLNPVYRRIIERFGLEGT